MPKTNHGGATAAGMTGVVEHGAPLADGRTKSELDPERNLDGTLIEGEHPDHADGEERETTNIPVTDPEPQPVDTPTEDEPAERTSNERTPTEDAGAAKPIKAARTTRK